MASNYNYGLGWQKPIQQIKPATAEASSEDTVDTLASSSQNTDPSIPTARSSSAIGEVIAGRAQNEWKQELNRCVAEFKFLTEGLDNSEYKGTIALYREAQVIKRHVRSSQFMERATSPEAKELRKSIAEKFSMLKNQSQFIFFASSLVKLNDAKLINSPDDINSFGSNGGIISLAFSSHITKDPPEFIVSDSFIDLYSKYDKQFSSGFQKKLFNYLARTYLKSGDIENIDQESLENVFTAMKMIEKGLGDFELPFDKALENYIADDKVSHRIDSCAVRLLRMVKMNAPLLERAATNFIDGASGYLPEEVKGELKEKFIDTLPSSYSSAILGENLDYQKMARRMLSPDANYYSILKGLDNDADMFSDEMPSPESPIEYEAEILSTLIQDGHESAQEELAQTIFKAANDSKKGTDSYDLSKLILSKSYETLVGNLDRPIGSLKNPEMLMDLFKDDFSRDEFDDAFDTGVVLGACGRSLFHYNPSPKFLRDITNYLFEEGIISEDEKQSFDSINKQIPGNNRSRENRRNLYKTLYVMGSLRLGAKRDYEGPTSVDDRTLTEIAAIDKLFSSLLMKMPSDSVTRELHSLLEAGSIEKHPLLDKLIQGDEIKAEIDSLLKTYLATDVEKEKKALKNKVKSKLSQANKDFNQEAIVSFLDLMKSLNTIAVLDDPEIIDLLNEKLEKLGDGQNIFQEIKNEYIKILTDRFSSGALLMEPEQISQLEAHVKSNPGLWSEDDFYINLLEFHSLKDDKSKEQVEKLFLMLSTAKDQSSIKKLRSKTVESFVAEQIGKNYTEDYDPASIKPDLKESYATILFNVKEHLGISKLADLEDAEFVDKFLDLYPQEKYQGLMDLVKELEVSLQSEDPIDAGQIGRWNIKAKELNLSVIFEDWNEFVNNINQLSVINRNRDVEIEEAQFKINSDPKAIIRSGEEPFYTCQRIIDITKQSDEGRPITRALYDNFTLAQTLVNGEIESRSILEVATCKADLWDMGDPVLLVERLYSKGLVPAKNFYGSIIDWAAKNTSLAYAAIPEAYAQSYETVPIDIKLSEYDAPIYRDTNWSKVKQAVDLGAYRESLEEKSS